MYTVSYMAVNSLFFNKKKDIKSGDVRYNLSEL